MVARFPELIIQTQTYYTNIFFFIVYFIWVFRLPCVVFRVAFFSRERCRYAVLNEEYQHRPVILFFCVALHDVYLAFHTQMETRSYPDPLFSLVKNTSSRKQMLSLFFSSVLRGSLLFPLSQFLILGFVTFIKEILFGGKDGLALLKGSCSCSLILPLYYIL